MPLIKVYCHKALSDSVVDDSYFGRRISAFRETNIRYVVFPDRFHYNCFYTRKELVDKYSMSALKKHCRILYY